jgi:UTP--glucose-1-phosphate uridylyltransferase
MSRTIKKAVVPAAGLGTRLLPATKSQPKEMLPVGRKPVMQHVVEELQSADLSQILVITGRRKRAVEDHFDFDPVLASALREAGHEQRLADLSFLDEDTRLFYTRQAEPKGLGHAVSLGANFVDGEHCVVALGDTLIGVGDHSTALRKMVKAHLDLDAAAVVAVEAVSESETHRYGIVSTGHVQLPSGEPVAMTDIVEKPDPGTAPTNLAVAARYVFGPEIFECLATTPPGWRGEIQLTDAIRMLIRRGRAVYAWLLEPEDRRYDIGSFESYFEACIDYALADRRYGSAARELLKEKASGI